MTTATIWDEALGQDRVLTEAEVRQLQQDAADDDLKHEVRQAAQEAFKLNIDAYINLRGRLDPEWNSVPTTDDDGADFDIYYGDTLSIEWKEWDRCGDAEYLRRDFPLSDLWHPDWEALIRGEVEQRDRAKREAEAARRAKELAAREAAERRTLRELLDKYGIPEDFQTVRMVHHG